MVDLIVFLGLLSLGYLFGRAAEKKHLRSIVKRESEYRDVLAFSERLPPPSMGDMSSQLVAGSVVISIDYFKRFVAGLRGLVGGRLTSYESLIDRARREAVLRMKEDAIEKGSKHIVNVKLESCSISKGAKGQIGSVEVFAYGTALISQ